MESTPAGEENKNEKVINKTESFEVLPVEPVSIDVVNNEINIVAEEINKQEQNIQNVVAGVEKIRSGFGLPDVEVEMPSVDISKKTVQSLENKKLELENKLQDILKHDTSEKYSEVINEVKQSKIDWANSAELARRLKLKGATEEDVEQVKNWVIDNTNNAKTFVLPNDKFKEAVNTIHEMTGEENIKQGHSFHIPGGRDDVPENIKSAVFIRENVPRPPMPGQKEIPKPTIDVSELHHEIGHAAQDGLLDSELYQDWKPKFKESAPDKEYVGLINETDTRITSVFRDLKETYDPNKEIFGKKQLTELRDKLQKGQLSEDTKDLLQHYDDIELVRLINRMPAI